MKSRSFTLAGVAVALILLRVAPARSATPPSQSPNESLTLTANIIAPLFGVYYAEGNIRFSRRIGMVVNVNHFSLESAEWTATATALGAGLSYYWQGEALRQWYIESVIEILLAEWRYDGSSNGTSSLLLGTSGSIIAGYRFICDFGLVVDLGVGLTVIHIPSSTAEANGERISPHPLTRLYPAAKVNAGWAL